MALSVTSPAFKAGENIPQKFTCDGANVSPTLQWSGIPEGTKSIALIVDDPDAPMGTWVHWVLFNLPANSTNLPEEYPITETLPNGAKHGLNDFKKTGYGGPCPPQGPAHRYFFKLYALNAVLNLPTKSTKAQLESAMQGHILAQGELMGKYGR